ncbi:MAG: CDP-alcohol phosphatidyltransferase family protein [candidate division Zixibacteria bacterium]|nr:CDP-alcohol phosphatidyltransferase family protein [candidate division Zixibacteria bacterium]
MADIGTQKHDVMYDRYEVRDTFWTVANLLSLSRIPLAVLIYLELSEDSFFAGAGALAILLIAGLTDFLDGLYARRRMHRIKRKNPYGVILDPLADKIFAGIVLVALLQFRDFPFWLAGTIVGRDIVIALGGMFFMKTEGAPKHSILSGKIYFGFLVALMGAYMIRNDFDSALLITLLTWITLALWALSSYSYLRIFLRAR